MLSLEKSPEAHTISPHDVNGALTVLGASIELIQLRLKEIDSSSDTGSICELLSESFMKVESLMSYQLMSLSSPYRPE